MFGPLLFTAFCLVLIVIFASRDSTITDIGSIGSSDRVGGPEPRRRDMSMRILFATRASDVMTIDGVIAEEVTDGWAGHQPSGCPVSMVVTLTNAPEWVVEASAATVERWADSEAVVDVALKQGPTGPCLQLSGDETSVRLNLADSI